MNPLWLRFRRPLFLAITVLVLALWMAPSSAQEVVRTSPYARAPATELRIQDDQILLDLEEAIVIALRNNIGLQVERYRRASANEGIRQSLGPFDLNLGLSASGSEETSASASALDGAPVREFEGQNLNLQLDQQISSGGVFSFDWTNSRSESNSFFSGINPSFSVNMDVLFNQPLLRGLGANATKRNIIVARINSEMSVESLLILIIDTIQQVEDTYWSLVEGQQQLEVALESLALAKNLHEMNRIQVEVGTLAPLEMTTSEVGVATREEAVLRAEAVAADTADLLRQLLNLEDGPYWGTLIVPTTNPLVDRIEVDVDESIRTAFGSRSEFRSQNLRIRSLEVDAKFQKNGALPRLDFQVRYGYNGIGGDVIIRQNIFDPTSPVVTIPGGYSDALEQVTDLTFKGWSTGLTFEVPIQNRAGRAASAIAELDLEESRFQLADLELSVKTEVRRTVRAVETAAEAIDLATITRELSESQLDAEQKRYDNGIATSYQVLEIQEDLSQARSREVTAIANYRRALVIYYKAIGRLLEENGIEIQDDLKDQPRNTRKALRAAQ